MHRALFVDPRPRGLGGAGQAQREVQRVQVSGEGVELTAYEYRLLEYLAMHAGEVVSKTTLAEHLYDEETDRDSNVVEVLVGRLRKKLDPGRRLKPIETLRGRGYRLRTADA